MLHWSGAFTAHTRVAKVQSYNLRCRRWLQEPENDVFDDLAAVNGTIL